ncbi:MAG TPA: GntG family PLP-dependent aldolase [Candidatus Angelobacter sp.]|nr:GntG family PLP-dependent aldolase [Candidatus Angelobacter sp.]
MNFLTKGNPGGARGEIELRSDTFTLPTSAMRQAIANAELGNDQYGEDPTVNHLEELAAGMLRKEAACLVVSGTMANQCCLLAWRNLGRKDVLVGDQSDIFVYEDHTIPEWAGIRYHALLTQPGGTLLLEDIRRKLREFDAQGALKAVLCLENPHNLKGGIVLGMEYLKEVAEALRVQDVAVHMDGARIFNAAARLQLSPAEIAQCSDSLQFCLSKGLAAPVGSMVAGRSAFIQEVRRQRKILGGDMRQAGIVAAAGIVALEQMAGRLEEDHVHAKALAEGLARIPGIQVDLNTVQTNTVVFQVTDKRFDCDSFIAAAWRYGLHVSEFEYGRIRAVTHHGITSNEVEAAIRIVVNIMQLGPGDGIKPDFVEQFA